VGCDAQGMKQFIFIIVAIFSLSGCGKASSGNTAAANAPSDSISAPQSVSLTEATTCIKNGAVSSHGANAFYQIEYILSTFSDGSIRVSCQTVSGSGLITGLTCDTQNLFTFSYYEISTQQLHVGNNNFIWSPIHTHRTFSLNQNSCTTVSVN
jgi:hypothetical protein